MDIFASKGTELVSTTDGLVLFQGNLSKGGKVVFVDYHKPHWAHPLKYVTSLVFDTLEPYAKSLWRNDIADFADNDPRFSWRKETYFGGLYQKVVATSML